MKKAAKKIRRSVVSGEVGETGRGSEQSMEVREKGKKLKEKNVREKKRGALRPGHRSRRHKKLFGCLAQLGLGRDLRKSRRWGSLPQEENEVPPSGVEEDDRSRDGEDPLSPERGGDDISTKKTGRI